MKSPAQTPETARVDGIRPLTFLNTYRTFDIIMAALVEHDDLFRHVFEKRRSLRTVARLSTLPLYYHWATSGYGAFTGDDAIGWLYLQGWHQAIHIAVLVVHPEWQGCGVGRRLLRFAEGQARDLHRRWLSLNVTVDNTPAVQLYESEGFQRAHWRFMRREAGTVVPPEPGRVRLQRLVGAAAGRCYRRFARLDLGAGELEASDILTGLLADNPYRRDGQHWQVWDGRRPIAYLNLNGAHAHPHLYLAAEPQHWGSTAALEAVKLALGTLGDHTPVTDIRLGSSGHHAAAHDALVGLGFSERPAARMKMFKRLDTPLLNLTPESESAND